MKININLTAAFALLCVLVCASCSKKQPELDSQTISALNEIDAQNAALEKAVKSTVTDDGKLLDFDLTKMNANMVYAQIFSLMMEPDSYAGKTFRMTGNFFTLPGQDGKPTYAVIVKDALACCQQGIEFKYNFPEKLPAQDQIITVTGKYTVTQNAEGISYNYLTAETVE